MGRYYDREGKKIILGQWSDLMEDDDYRRVALDLVDDRWSVSTVWLGLDHQFLGDGPPLIFETMVFDKGSPSYHDMEQRRYSTLEQALAGHAEMVQLAETWKETT
jgi:hypothetical protein